MFLAAPSLHDRFDPRRNSLWSLRLTLAGVVAVVHAQDLGWGDQPALGQTLLGDLAVDAFFVISGFLVTRSALRLPTVRRFAWHRALRIMPGFWVCLLMVAFIVAPLVAVLEGRSPWVVVTAGESSFEYVVRNAALLIRQWDIANLTTSYGAGALNGSLWTLFFEALCYSAVGALVAAGLLYRHAKTAQRPTRIRLWLHQLARTPVIVRLTPRLVRRHPLLVVAGLVWVVQTLGATGVVALGPDFLARFLLLFLLGGLGHLYAGRLRFPLAITLVAAVILSMSLWAFADYRPVGAAAFAYLLLWAVVGLPMRINPAVDLSYGLYVYHWPVIVLLERAGATVLGRPGFTLVAVLLAALVATASWRFVEGPALRYKDASWIDTLPRYVRHRLALR